MREVYLDNSATTKITDAAAKAALEVMTTYYGNPSSLHGKGIEAEKLLKKAREQVAKALGVKPAEVYFTSGGRNPITSRLKELPMPLVEGEGTSLLLQ